MASNQFLCFTKRQRTLEVKDMIEATNKQTAETAGRKKRNLYIYPKIKKQQTKKNKHSDKTKRKRNKTQKKKHRIKHRKKYSTSSSIVNLPLK